MVDIISAKFKDSLASIKTAPPSEEFNEVVFIARSNTGKSSLINGLTNISSLAKVSQTPGKTRLINYFDVVYLNREDDTKLDVVFVDLPGFGYAKVSKSLKDEWEESLTNFLLKRENISLFIHLVDSRHPHLEIDRSVDEFLNQIKKPHQKILKIFTKIDKLNQKEQSALKKEFGDVLVCSSAKKRGLKEINSTIYKILKEAQDEHRAN
ncbi:MAG: ribosome biogenesis GTP-binding protein YihA/YsxC [Sulfurimonas sp.]|nr:ribosome biogenesis GTP-binding protein YihA/YsxC [Sulfurimonadaceae bacterium]